MRITLGVDHGDTHAAASLVERLQFRDAVVDFAHVLAPAARVLADKRGTVSAEPASLDEQRAKKLLAQVSSGFPCWETCTFRLLRGNPTEALLKHADETHANLIVVNASQRSPLLAFLTGSVARGVVSHAKQSVLLVRGDGSAAESAYRPLRAVLATDHSEYMARCLDKLGTFLPQGLAHLSVLTVFPDKYNKRLKAHLPHFAVDAGAAIRHELEARNEALATRLRKSFAAGSTTVSTQVSCAPLEEAILTAMQESEADLLIIGAQGHSLLEQLARRSVSLRQAMGAPYSLLILRLSPQEMDELQGSDHD